MLTKQEALLGRGGRAESRRLRDEEPGVCSCRMALSSPAVTGLFPGCLWRVILTQGPSWQPAHCSAKMESSKEDSGRWPDTWRLLLTFPEL